MAGGGIKKGAGAGEVELNVVPLIDVACMLIMFFILTSQLASANFAALQLANPSKSEAEKSVDNPNRVIVNVTSKLNPNVKDPTMADEVLSLQADYYKIDGEIIPIGNVEQVQMLLKTRKKNAELMGYPPADFFVEVRADARVSFEFIQPVLMAAANAEIKAMRITAMAERGK